MEEKDANAKHENAADFPHKKNIMTVKNEQSVAKDARDLSDYMDQENAFKDFSFIMWENTSNMCWLDASMAVLVHNRTMRHVFNLNPSSQVSKIINAYDKAMKILNNFSSDQNTEERLKVARDLLQNVQDSSLKYLQPLLKFKKGEPESAHHSLLSLIKEDKSIQEYFDVTYAWIRSCENCDMTRVVSCKKPIITITNVIKFAPEEQFSPINCQYCNKKDQKMRLIYKKLPPCLIFHFENGAGDGNNLHLKFKVASREYQLTAIMMLEKGQESNVNHFVTYIRDPVNDKWLECNDLDMDLMSFTSDLPDEISPDKLCVKDIYIYVFEAFDDLGTVKIEEDPSLKNSSHSIPCIELSDGEEDDNSSSRETSVQNKEGSGGETVEKTQSCSASALNEDSISVSKFLSSSKLDQNKIKSKKEFSNKNGKHKCNETFMNQLANLSNELGDMSSFLNENKEIDGSEQNVSCNNSLIDAKCNRPGENALTLPKKLETLQNDKVTTPVSNVIDFEEYIKKRLFEYNSKSTVPFAKIQAKEASMPKGSNESSQRISGKLKINALNDAIHSHNKTQMCKSDSASCQMLTSQPSQSYSEKESSMLNELPTLPVSSKIDENNKSSSTKQEPQNKPPVNDKSTNQNSLVPEQNNMSSHKLKHESQKPKTVSEGVSTEKIPVFSKSGSKKPTTKQEQLSKQENIEQHSKKNLNHLQQTVVKSSTYDGTEEPTDSKNVSKQQKQISKPEEKEEQLTINKSTIMACLNPKKINDSSAESSDMPVENLVTPNVFAQNNKNKKKNKNSSTEEIKVDKSTLSPIRNKELDTETKLETVKSSNDMQLEKNDNYHENEMETQEEEMAINCEVNKNVLQKSSPKKSKNRTKVSASEDLSSKNVVPEMQQPSSKCTSTSPSKVKLESNKRTPPKVKLESYITTSPSKVKLKSYKITSPAKVKDGLKKTGKKNKKEKSPVCASSIDGEDTDFLDSEKTVKVESSNEMTENSEIYGKSKKHTRNILKVRFGRQTTKCNEGVESEKENNTCASDVKAKKKKSYVSDENMTTDESSPSRKKVKTGNSHSSKEASPADNHVTSEIAKSSNEPTEKVPPCPNPDCPCVEADSDIILDGTVDFFLTQILETFIFKRDF